MVAAGWSPEQWISVVTVLISSITSAAVAIIGALRAKDVQKKIETSNGKTIAQMIEDNHVTIEQKVIPVAEKADAVVDKQIEIMNKADEILQEQQRVKEELLDEHKRNNDHD